MRFYEIKKLLEFAQNTEKNETSELLGILNNPKTSENLKQKIKALFNKILQSPAVKQPPTELPTNESAGITLTQDQKVKIEQELAQRPELQAYLDAIKSQASKEGITTGVALARDPDAVIQDLNTQINDRLKKLPQIPAEVRSAVAKEAFDTIRQTKNSKAVLAFLDACVHNDKPIDLESIINKGGSGRLVDPSNPYFEIIRHLAKINPGSGNSSTGQGEWMLVLAGKNTKKISPGDISVGNVKVEVKASDTKEGKKSLTDFVLNSQKLPLEQAKSHLVNYINNVLGKKAVSVGTATQGGISQLNNITLKRLNPLFVEMNKIKPNSVQEAFIETWRIIMPDTALDPYIKKIAEAIDPDGVIDLTKMYGPTATLAAAYYKLSNQHDALLLLNIPSLSYTVVNDPAEMTELMKKDATTLTMSSIFDFREKAGGITFKRLGPKEK
jgi:hypothetical protein